MKYFWRVLYRIGHRGAFLLALAILDILFGWSLLTDPAQLKHAELIFSLNMWGFTWLAIGFILLIGAFTYKDRVFYGIASAVKAMYAAAWVNVWIFDHAIPRPWANMTIWAVFSLLVLVVSSWPEARSNWLSKSRRTE